MLHTNKSEVHNIKTTSVHDISSYDARENNCTKDWALEKLLIIRYIKK